MIDNAETLVQWKSRAAAQPRGRVVLDLEADSLHRYHEKICLIQYADADGACIIDPLAIEDMRLFSDWLAEADVWMHGADYDMSLFLQTFGHLPHFILDTQTAARFLGFRQFGLAALVERFYDIVLSKTNQKADWGKRPLSDAMQEYAQGDVVYMLGMADTMCAKLRELGRYDWFVETCRHNMERARERFAAGVQDPWRIKGSGRLNRRGLAALQALWAWRDAEAAAWDRPSFMVCSNDDLIRWSSALQEFDSVQTPPRFHRHRALRFLEAIEKFHAQDEETYPPRILRQRPAYDERFEARLDGWLARRNAAAEQLDLDPSFVASRAVMEAIARNEEEGLGHLLGWQKEALGLSPS